MSLITIDRIMCFRCLQLVDEVSLEGEPHVRCFVCDTVAPIAKAMDDCFLFIVASAVSDRLSKSFAHRYDFMPLVADRTKAVEDRSFMVRTGRALLAA